MRHSSRPICGTRERKRKESSCITTSLCTRRFLSCFRRRDSTTLGSLCQHPRRFLPTIGRHKSRTRRKKRLFRARPFERGGSQKDAARRARERKTEKERGRRVDDVCFAVVDISGTVCSQSVLIPLSLSYPFLLLSCAIS